MIALGADTVERRTGWCNNPLVRLERRGGCASVRPVRLAVIELSPRKGWSARLDPGAVIGRRRDCDLLLPDAMVSRRHARVCERGVSTAIEDLGSHNGLYVNGRRCHEPVALHPGDRIVLGRTTWLVIPANETVELGASESHVRLGEALVSVDQRE